MSTIETVTDLAKRIATVIPAPSESLYDDAPSHRAWEDLMLEAAHGIAAAVDHYLLRQAVGPALEVGVNPPWRALLEVALLISAPANGAERMTPVLELAAAHG
ncbi:hypothetical protein ACWEK5_44665 [Rhodococcus koreensis]